MLFTVSNVAKFMSLYTRCKMYTVGCARVKLFDLYKI